MKIAVLIASFNRVAVTLRGVSSLLDAASRAPSAQLEIFLLDDASPDNTGVLVKERFPEIHVIEGTGNLFWNRGMCRAYQAARASGVKFDAYLLFNDDIVLYPAALEQMTAVFIALNRTASSAVVGAMCSAKSGVTTYYGHCLNPKYNPLRHGKPGNPPLFITVLPDGTLRNCDTFSGNCVLVPGAAMEKAGGLDPKYRHMYGDVDLGMTLRKNGCRTYLMPDHMGTCERDPLPAATPRLFDRLRAVFYPPCSVFDEMHLAFRRFPWPIAILNASLRLKLRFKMALFPEAIAARRISTELSRRLKRPFKAPPPSVERWPPLETARRFLVAIVVDLPAPLEAAARDFSNAIRPRTFKIDTFLVSFPKCGRTWLEVMLAHAFAQRFEMNVSAISRNLLTTRARARKGPAIQSTHDWSEAVGETQKPVSPHLLFAYSLRTRYWGRRVLMLIRDPRDAIVSNFYQSTQRSFFPLSFDDIDEYVLHPLYGFPRLVRFYRIWALNRHLVRVFKIVRYEELMTDGPATLRSILEFVGLKEIPDEEIRAIYNICSFDRMRLMEEKGQVGLFRFHGPNASKTRRGVIGGYKDELKAETIEKLNSLMRQIPEPFRYAIEED